MIECCAAADAAATFRHTWKTHRFRRAAGHRRGFGKLGRVIALTRPNAFIFAQDCATSFSELAAMPVCAGDAVIFLWFGGFAMNAMLTKYLKDFSVPTPVGPVGNDFLHSLPGASLSDMDFDVEPDPPVDIEAERREAHEEGYREASADCESRHADEMSALREAHAAELRALTDAHESETIWMIHTRFHEMTQAISQTVGEQTLQVLLPVFEEEICRRSIAHLTDMVREALSEAEISTVVVRGPERLYVRLKPLLEVDGVETRFVENASADISVEINDTVLVTRLSSWAKALSEVTG